MSKLVILNLGKGDLNSGFPFVTLQIQDKLCQRWWQFQGSLPANSSISELYYRWQLLYQLFYEARTINIGLRHSSSDEIGIKIDDADVTHFSDVEFSEISSQLQKQINIWLDAEGFRNIERQLRMELVADESIQFILQAEDKQIRKLPWHVWSFFQDYSQAELALSAIEFKPLKKTYNYQNTIKILAILGDSTGIDINTDRKILENLPNSRTVFLVEPTRQQLDELLWDERGWDILFFAGHSNSKIESDTETAYICINKNFSLTIPQLKNSLKKAVDNGLQIAIFNSCNGLGLAQKLDDIHIPQVIVMREPVPDKVAQEFLKNFLKNFAFGQSFYLSVRQAREKLQGLESEFPGASWLPVIYQNPGAISPTWENLSGKDKEKNQSFLFPKRKLKLNLKSVFALSITLTTLLIGTRSFGIFQKWELQVFDHFMQMYPLEEPDKRLLIVGIDEKDIRTYGYPLPDAVLSKLLDKLKKYHSSAIGLNIVRDLPVPNHDIIGHQSLVNNFQTNSQLTTICAFNNSSEQSIAPPPKSKENQVGFVDLYDDSLQTHSQDKTIRRYLLSRSENPISQPSSCNTQYSLAWQLTYNYFKYRKIPVSVIKNDWKFGSLITKRLQNQSGSYQNLDAAGNQILIKYRHIRQPEKIAQQVTLRDILNENKETFDPNWIKDRVILIGVVASSIKDTQQTPYGEMRSLHIHAHVTSQILSAVEDNRVMLWWLPEWGEILWIFSWGFSATTIIWLIKNPLHQSLALCICGTILYGSCWIIFSFGGWIPIFPAILIIVAAWGVNYLALAIRKTS
ncbi:CHASE2 domain-containing protein [Calothrix sp. UHCC 0171]|uniref:CHASE2 domain-containing protein n=1 Tax=Calothrix sp. UHCC 0171 TaxID=3110245 RepID=UPI002B1F8931|nr:CHASE2 domain-containing protein [Calothrix sp. UHCC 0171]MEA5573007.1 CHASE2 domain-containing protein [Calothrix sp. UHCC 0171]